MCIETNELTCSKNAAPEFSEMTGGFLVSFFKAKEEAKTTLKLPENYPETTRKIVELIEKNSYLTRKEIAKAVGITEDGIKYHLNKMCKDKIIKRIGTARGGHWRVCGQD